MPQHEVVPEKLTLFQRICHSIFPGKLRPVIDREGYRRFFNTLILHFRPRRVPERTLRFTLHMGAWRHGRRAGITVDRDGSVAQIRL